MSDTGNITDPVTGWEYEWTIEEIDEGVFMFEAVVVNIK